MDSSPTNARRRVAVTLTGGRQEHDIEITFAASARVAHLLDVLEASGFQDERRIESSSADLWCGQARYGPDVFLGVLDLFEGCHISLTEPEQVGDVGSHDGASRHQALQAVAGLGSGRVLAAACDRDAFVADADSIWEDVSNRSDLGSYGAICRGHVVHRVPRPVGREPAAEATTGELVLPSAPARPERPSMIVLLAPVPVAIVIALILNPLFMLFAGSGLVTAGARHVDALRRYRKSSRSHQGEVAKLESDFARGIELVIDDETERRRGAQPTAHELFRRATGLDPRLWERRRDDSDFGVVAIARGDESLFESPGPTVSAVPLLVDLGTVSLGVVGPRPAAVAVARAVAVSLAVNSGPGEHPFVLLLQAAAAAEWAALKWLPHLDSSRVATNGETVAEVGEALTQLGEGVRPIVFLDGVELWRSVSAAVRSTYGQAGLVVIANETSALPSQCRVILQVDSRGNCHVLNLDAPSAAETGASSLAIGVSKRFTEQVSRALAPLVDADEPPDPSGRVLPDAVSLADVSGPVADAADIASAWLGTEADPGAPAAVGVGVEGPIVLDLAADGPHALLAGTTGAGKSEFLRTWVLAMAQATSPEDLNLVLLDYKGGGAFDACAQLPHTAAVVTDLDPYLGQRALRGLTAELRRRELLLRDAEASDLSAFRKLGRRMPRLVLVVDEFATLASELPDVLDALIDVAQRGRSLGLHLVLATQRPAGVLDAKIRANTNLRVALRVQDEADSYDVIGVVDAVKLSRRSPGRGIIRAGSDELVRFQAAYVSGRTRADVPPVEVRSFGLGAEFGCPASHAIAPDGPTDLERYVDLLSEAAVIAKCAPVRQPWLPPLPETCCHISTGEAAGPQGAVKIALADSPETQSREPVWFEPAKGHLVVHGVAQAETEATLFAITSAVLDTYVSGRVCVHVVDGGTRQLSHGRLRSQSIGRDDTADVLDFIERMEAELDYRRRTSASNASQSPCQPLVLLVIDGIDFWIDGLISTGSHDIANRVVALLRDGPSLGLVAVMSTRSERGVPTRISAQVSQRFSHRLADPAGFLGLGIRPSSVPDLLPRQAVDITTGRHIVMLDACSEFVCGHGAEEFSIARTAR